MATTTKKKELNSRTKHYWMAIIGGVPKNKLPMGADSILRQPVRDAYNKAFGADDVCSSGWGMDQEQYDMISYISNMAKQDLKKLFKIAKIINQIR